jgi:hypothetical protein
MNDTQLKNTVLSAVMPSVTFLYRYTECWFDECMKNTYCLFQVKFITEYTNVQHIIITQM